MAGRSQLVETPGIVVDAGGTLAVASTHVLEGPAGLIKNGAGTLRLEGAHEYLGDTDLVQGVLQVGHDQSLGTAGALVFSDATKVARWRRSAARAAWPIGWCWAHRPSDWTGRRACSRSRPTPRTAPRHSPARAPPTWPARRCSDPQLSLTGAGSLTKAGDGTLTSRQATRASPAA
jgi:autotransporter-associated beta strand protein